MGRHRKALNGCYIGFIIGHRPSPIDLQPNVD